MGYDMEVNFAAIVGAVTAVICTILLKVADKALSRKEVAFDQTARQVDQLVAQIKSLQERQNYLEEQLTEWKDKYYRLVEELATVRAERDTMTSDMGHLREEFSMLSTQVVNQGKKNRSSESVNK